MQNIQLLHAALFTPREGNEARWGLPILYEGEPGVAKTSVLKGYARRLNAGTKGGFACEVLSPGERGEGAFGVVPVPATRPDGRVVLTNPAPEWADSFFTAKRGLVFCDEITNAPPLIQAPMLGLLTELTIGGAKLPNGTRVLGACNPPELAAYGHDLSPPLANRFGWQKWHTPEVAEHAIYMLGQASRQEGEPIDAEAEEARVLAAWPEAYAQAVGLETAFLQAQSDWKNKCPRAGDPKAGRAWPSDRTWTYATLALASSYVHKLSPELQDELVAGFVGLPAYEQFSAFIEHADLPKATDVLDGTVKFTHNKARLDRTAAVLNSCTALVTSMKDDGKKVKRADTLWTVLGSISADAADIVVPSAQALVQSGLHTSKSAMPVLGRLSPMLAAYQD